MNRDEAFELMLEMIQSQNLRRHALAVEAIMRALARKFNEDEGEWGIVGLLHDADYELIEKDPARHTLVTAEKLKELGVSERIINGIKAHHDTIKPNRENLMEKAVYAADDTSGLITATALVKDRKLANVTLENLVKKFGEKNFAAGAKREQIRKGVEELGIPMEEFLAISLKAMQNISEELGL